VNNDWAFLPMRSSNDLLGDPDALRARLDEDSYLYFQGVLDPDKLLALRREMLTVLADHGWVLGGDLLMDAVVGGAAFHEDQEEFLDVYGDVQRLQAFHTFAHDDRLTDLMRQVVGPTAFPHSDRPPRWPVRGVHRTRTTPTTRVTGSAAWIPVGDCPRELSPSPPRLTRGPDRWRSTAGWASAGRPRPEMLEGSTGHGFAIGDVLVFPSLTVHAAQQIPSSTCGCRSTSGSSPRGRPDPDRLTALPATDLGGDLRGWTSDGPVYWRTRLLVVPFETFPSRRGWATGFRAPCETGDRRDGGLPGLAGVTSKPAGTERRHARVASSCGTGRRPQTTPGT
jgi:hypothetical protein